jgi:hypothetical protein
MRKRDRADHILEMSMVVKKVDEVYNSKVEISHNINQIATMMACMVEMNAINIAFQTEKDSKINNSLKEIRNFLNAQSGQSGNFFS